MSLGRSDLPVLDLVGDLLRLPLLLAVGVDVRVREDAVRPRLEVGARRELVKRAERLGVGLLRGPRRRAGCGSCAGRRSTAGRGRARRRPRSEPDAAQASRPRGRRVPSALFRSVLLGCRSSSPSLLGTGEDADARIRRRCWCESAFGTACMPSLFKNARRGPLRGVGGRAARAVVAHVVDRGGDRPASRRPGTAGTRRSSSSLAAGRRQVRSSHASTASARSSWACGRPGGRGRRARTW